MSSDIKSAKRLVVKVGSSLVTNRGQGLDHAALSRWAGQIAGLRHGGREVVLVSSGAIAAGMQRLMLLFEMVPQQQDVLRLGHFRRKGGDPGFDQRARFENLARLSC